MINVGDVVLIDRTGGQYESYRSFFELYGLEEYLSRWNKIPSKAGMICKVLDVHSHHQQAGMPIYVLEELDSGSIYLYNDSTISVVSIESDAFVVDCKDLMPGDTVLLSGELDYFLGEYAWEQVISRWPEEQEIAEAVKNPGGKTLHLRNIEANVLLRDSNLFVFRLFDLSHNDDRYFYRVILTDTGALSRLCVILQAGVGVDIDLLSLLA